MYPQIVREFTMGSGPFDRLTISQLRSRGWSPWGRWGHSLQSVDRCLSMGLLPFSGVSRPDLERWKPHMTQTLISPHHTGSLQAAAVAGRAQAVLTRSPCSGLRRVGHDEPGDECAATESIILKGSMLILLFPCNWFDSSLTSSLPYISHCQGHSGPVGKRRKGVNKPKEGEPVSFFKHFFFLFGIKGSL